MSAALLALMLAAGGEAQAAPSDKPRLICREGEQMVGSHIRTPRRCKSEEEWRREEEGRTPSSTTFRIVKGQEDGLVKERPPW